MKMNTNNENDRKCCWLARLTLFAVWDRFYQTYDILKTRRHMYISLDSHAQVECSSYLQRTPWAAKQPSQGNTDAHIHQIAISDAVHGHISFTGRRCSKCHLRGVNGACTGRNVFEMPFTGRKWAVTLRLSQARNLLPFTINAFPTDETTWNKEKTKTKSCFTHRSCICLSCHMYSFRSQYALLATHANANTTNSTNASHIHNAIRTTTCICASPYHHITIQCDW